MTQNKFKQILKTTVFTNRPVQLILVALAGVFLGWILFHQPSAGSDNYKQGTKEKSVGEKQIWTCSMHPQIRQDHPGKCPLCGMDLIPLVRSKDGPYDSTAVHLTSEAIALANISTSIVGHQNSSKTLTLFGKVQADERLIESQTAHISGRIERLFVNYTGESVHTGQVLALINSPDLISAQQELLEAAKNRNVLPGAFEAAKARLRQWKLSEKQVDKIIHSAKIKENFEVLAGSSGIVTNKRVNTGDYVSPGDVLFEVSNLSRVWVLFDAYESDLPFLKKGDAIRFRFQALPDKEFQANIRFIDPVMDAASRVARVRVEIPNQQGLLKPEMFATGMVQANLNQYKNKLVIPSTAVLWTGKRSVVYVKQPGEEPVFKLREIDLGSNLGNSYIVSGGLEEGEEIVTEGAFSVDATSQLEGKPSMLNP
jgi:membrane fusion protein, copper/silver efflux system